MIMATYMLYLLFVGVLAMVLGTVTNVIRSYRRLSHIPGPLHVEWHQRGPFIVQARRFARDGPWMTSLRMFTQQYWLEASSWVIMARKVATRQNLRHLSITIRHSDWWWSESSAPLALDAKQKGKPLAKRHSTATDVFHVQSWGNQFSMFKGMKTFELELETVEGKRKELDEVIVRAADWRFPLGDCNFLVLNPARTKRTGWQGYNLPSGLRAPSDPKEAKERLVKDGVDFTVWDGEPEIEEEDCLTYYVVSLTYEAQRGHTSS